MKVYYFFIFVLCVCFATLTFNWGILEKNKNIVLKDFDKSSLHESQNNVTKEDQMKRRNLVMREACNKHGIQNISINPWEYFINEKYSLVWCNVFKSGSTSWMFIMNALAGYPEKYLKETKRYPLLMAREKYSRPSKKDLFKVLENENSVSVIIGRHPFERVVSAYRDKIVGAQDFTLHDKIRRNITRYFRGVKLPKVKRLPKEYIPTFSEFVRYLVKENGKGREPDMHWAPVYKFCTPCQVNFNSIIYFDTFDEDTTHILKKVNSPIKSRTIFKNPSKFGVHSKNLTNSYIIQLNDCDLKSLIKLYQVDFDLFGFSKDI